MLLVNVRWNDNDLELLFNVRNGIEESDSNSWLIKATSIHEYKLFEAHVECVQDWMEFDKYINTEQKLSKLIQAGFGKLACGPIFLLQEYIKVLDRFGVNSNLADITPPKRWNGNSWVEYATIPEMIHFGGSYIVADSFYASKQ